MKKNILLILSIISLIFCIHYFRLTISKDVTLAGTKINEYLYSYNLNDNNSSLNGFTIIEDYIYYLLKYETHYELNKQNIYSKTKEKIKEYFTSDYCTIENEYIFCYTSNKSEVFDLNFNKLDELTIKENEEIYLIPYKDTFLKYTNNTLYLTQNNKEVNFKTIDIEASSFENIYISNTNTYILLSNSNLDTYYIYDINKGEYQTINSSSAAIYQSGFYFYDQNKFQLYDLEENNTKEYANKTTEEYFYASTFSNNIFYLYEVKTNTFIILNYNNNTIATKELNLENPIDSLSVHNDYLYIHINADKDNFYIVDLEALNLPSNSIDDYQQEEENNINSIISKIKDEHNVNIYVKETAVIDFPDFYAISENNNKIIMTSLNKLEPILSKFDNDFYSSFYSDAFTGLNIYLTGALQPMDYSTQISNPAAYSLTYNGKYMIVIDINQNNIEELLCHELLHNIELNLKFNNIEVFLNWSKYNPNDFNYLNSYTKITPYNYTLSEEKKDNVYFIDKYSHSYASEDRARIFEAICSCEENSIITEYPNLYSKALYLKEEIIKNYPTLNSSSLFNSLN